MSLNRVVRVKRAFDGKETDEMSVHIVIRSSILGMNERETHVFPDTLHCPGIGRKREDFPQWEGANPSGHHNTQTFIIIILEQPRL